MNIALLGPTCSGKGTLIQALALRFQLHPVAPGELLRHKVAQGTALGLLTKSYVLNGEFVPDEIVDAMVEEALRRLPPGPGCVLDGFPRTVAQARFLDDLMGDLGRRLDAVIYLDVPQRIVFERAAHRQPARQDDEPHILAHRLHVFRRMVAPVLRHFYESGRLVLLRADVSLKQVETGLERILEGVSRGVHPEFTELDFSFLDEFLKSRTVPPVSPDSTLNLVVIGGPGSGKGTQAELLCETFQLPHISTGDLFRENIHERTELGRIAKAYMDRGELVPDDVTEQMVGLRLGAPDAARGFLLDGFPRTAAQAEGLDEILHRMGRRVTGAIHLAVSDGEIVRRLSGRRICRRCQASFHTLFRKPRHEGVCDKCGGELDQRIDDRPEAIEVRLRTYHRQTEPLLAYYREAGILTNLKGEGDVSAIRAAMLAAVRLFSEEPVDAMPR